MVDVAGHLGMALLWLAPAWIVLDRPETAGTFVASGFLFGMFPDVDLAISPIVPTVKHHGVFHTVAVVTVLAAVVGPLVGRLVAYLGGRRELLSTQAEATASRFGFFAVWVAGLGHIFADVLSAPDVSEAIEPFWPLYRQPLGVDVVWYNDPWVNWGLLAAGILVNLGLYAYRR
ncbi:metal-dependent hydrolase [Halomicroarcula sp. GCM10025817]|uniref:metal-dependent hydrolase n=1 Tax=Haloarcula TaxID=2237 RepID=UPI0023E8EE0F|nr:metal-dependent hydrolase [Halomicroarcula sp. SYNS111]